MSQRPLPPEPFVPFGLVPPAAPGRPVEPVPPPKVVRGGETAPPFTPLEMRPTSSGQAATCRDKPVVTVQREGERVVQVRVECTCGQVIELGCQYDDNKLAP